jgi:hypothetical protein
MVNCGVGELTSLIPNRLSNASIETQTICDGLFFVFFRFTEASSAHIRKQKTHNVRCEFPFAEKEGFEPPVPCGTTVFKTAAFDHSAISPLAVANIKRFFYFIKLLEPYYLY